MAKTPLKATHAQSKEKISTASTSKPPHDEVEEFMARLQHPLKVELGGVRKIIRNANKKINERMKWNAPSYYYKEDLVTFNPRALQHVHLVFHHAAVTKIQSPLLQGDYKDRRMVFFNNMKCPSAKSRPSAMINMGITSVLSQKVRKFDALMTCGPSGYKILNR